MKRRIRVDRWMVGDQHEIDDEKWDVLTVVPTTDHSVLVLLASK